jgi:hypothetical protein
VINAFADLADLWESTNAVGVFAVAIEVTIG